MIGATTNTKGLSIRAELDVNRYPTGIKISDAEMAGIEPQFSQSGFHGGWNHTCKRARPRSTATSAIRSTAVVRGAKS